MVTVNGDEETVRACYARLQQKNIGEDALRFAAFQLERGDEGGRLHVQAYFEFSRGVRHTHVARFVGCPCHHEGAREDHAACVRYVTKEDTRAEGPCVLGQGPQQGRRTDLEAVRAMVDQGSSELELWQEHFEPMVRHYQAIRRYAFVRQLSAVVDREPPVVRVFWGGSGLGKTRRARYEAQAAGRRLYAPTLPERGQQAWFCGYEPECDILLDDYHGEYGLSFFKRLLDRYPMQLPAKYGQAVLPARSVTFYITSNHNPMDWYAEATQEDRDAIRRRFSLCVHFIGPWEPPQVLPDEPGGELPEDFDEILALIPETPNP